MTNKGISVKAPGSSANLGPGFDVLGMAVDLYCVASDHGEGEACGSEHIARIAYEAAGGTGPIWFDFDLPPSRGLGFSAAARAAGAVLAFVQAGYSLEDAREPAYSVVLDLEGHGDNAAPAVFGGIQITVGDIRFPVSAPFPAELLFWAMEARTLTDESRARLPELVPRADAVFNAGRVALLVASIYEGDPTRLGVATQDRLHQDIRFLARPRSKETIDAVMAAGALGAWLSGSGPTVAIACRPGEREEIARALSDDGQIFRLSVDQEGCTLV